MDPALAAEAARAAEQFGIKDDIPQPATEQQPEATPEAVASEAPVEAPQSQDEPAKPEAAVETQPVVQSEEEDEDTYPSFTPYRQPEQPVQPQVPQQPAPPAPQPVQSQPQLPALDPAQFTDQYGNVDMAKFSAAMRARDEQLMNQVTGSLTGNLTQMAQALAQHAERVATERVQAVETEKRGWDRTFTKYPQIRENKELRDQIHKMRLGEVAVTGKPVSPVKMADRYFAQIAAAREDGVKQATQTVQVQATAHLETADNTASDKGLQTRQNWERTASRNRNEAEGARRDILKQLLADGKL